MSPRLAAIRRTRRRIAAAVAATFVLAWGVVAGLVIGKPVGLLSASALAVWLGLAIKPSTYSWRQLAGAGALAGIGFTMSLFIAGQSFPDTADFAAAKVAVFVASILATIIGVALLWSAAPSRAQVGEENGEIAATSA